MIARALLAFGAYSPVAVLTGIRITRTGTSWALIGIGIGAALCMFIVLARARVYSSDIPITIIEIEDKGAEVPAYMMGYLLPFVTVADPTNRDLTVLVAFGVVLLYVSARSSVVTVNPLLYLIGLQAFEAKIESGHGAKDTVTLLAKHRPVPVTDVGERTTNPPATGRLVASGIYLIGAR